MHTSLRRARAQHFHTLFAALREVQAKIGNKRYRTTLEVQRRAETQRRRSPVGHLVHVEVTATSEGTPTLRWWIDRQTLIASGASRPRNDRKVSSPVYKLPTEYERVSGGGRRPCRPEPGTTILAPAPSSCCQVAAATSSIVIIQLGLHFHRRGGVFVL